MLAIVLQMSPKGWVTYWLSYAIRHYHWWCLEIQKSYWIWKFMYCNLLLLYLSKHRRKKIIYQFREQLKIYEINQRWKLWACVLIAVSSCPAAAYVHWWTLLTINLFVVSRSRKNIRVTTKKIRNIQ